MSGNTSSHPIPDSLYLERVSTLHDSVRLVLVAGASARPLGATTRPKRHGSGTGR
jgi:hypothetical protein